MLKLKYFLADIFILSAEKQPIKLSWRKIEGLHPLFENLPVENMVYANQQAYYDAITESSRIANSGPFIDFMLNEILNALNNHQINQDEDVGINVGINERNILTIIANSPTATIKDMADALGLSQRQCERLVSELKRKNFIRRVGSNKSGYWEVVDFS